ncbi:glycosyltransferase [Brachybacterium timonense]|uniref:glycosyltransferase n=1 Tax=Brachybacterium timonense TaxID=2050896 RepID=UPI000D0B07CF|nr:glycosyltransferase [Brachybacterium timonense]
MSAVDLSVVIPAWNAEKTLSAQLDALAEQRSGITWEVIIADNGSRDGTRALVEHRAAEFPVPLRVVDASERRGAAHARNRGVSEARGETIAFCDADDRVGEGWIHAAHCAVQDLDVAGGTLRELRDPFDPKAPSVGYGAFTRTAAGGFGVLTCNMVIRRETFLDVEGFSTQLPAYGGEDSEFSLRLGKSGARVGLAPAMVVFFRSTTDVRTALRKVYLGSKAEVIIWRMHPDLFPVQQSRTILLREALGLPIAAAQTWSRRGKRPAARLLVRFAAHLSMFPRWKRHVPEPPGSKSDPSPRAPGKQEKA